MSDKLEKLVEELSGLTIMEAAELSKKLEDKWGVSAAAPVAVAAVGGGAEAGAGVEEKTEFTVVLASFDAAKKINLIKVIREVTGLGLKEAKDLVEGAPGNVKESVNKEEAQTLKAKIEEAGGKVELK